MGYAATNIQLGRVNGKKNIQMILMHRIVAQTPKGKATDHINGDRLDNRKCNLRICTQSENSKNRRLRKGNKCGYNGVVRWERDHNWSAQIMADRRNIRIGYFETKEQAAVAYNHYARIYHGEFASINIVPSEIMSQEEQSVFVQSWLNSRGHRHNISGARGVTKTISNRWCARIKKKGEEFYLGLFDTMEEASHAYNSKAVELYGEKAVLNPI